MKNYYTFKRPKKTRSTKIRRFHTRLPADKAASKGEWIKAGQTFNVLNVPYIELKNLG